MIMQRTLGQLGKKVMLASACTIAAAAFTTTAHAQIGSARYASIIVDHENGRVMEAINADEERYPASLTKLMTLYMAFDALRAHRVTLTDTVPVSDFAASQEPSKLGLLPGTKFTIGDAILGIVTKSANDAACALGEKLGGSEPRFAQSMTERARMLGMTHTTFRNASGLPNPQQVTTARDLAVLAHRLIQDYPEYYRFFSVETFYFHGRAIPNHDHMLKLYAGADGLKTGYTQAAGHNLVTSAVRGDIRLIGVVLGARSNGERDLHMASLLDDGFQQLGVPIVRRPGRVHLPSLIETADAATPHAHVMRVAAFTPIATTPSHHHHSHHATVVASAAKPASTHKLTASAAKPHSTHKAHPVRSASRRGHVLSVSYASATTGRS